MTYTAPDHPRAVVLMLHGGKPRSRQAVDGRSASWRRSDWMARTIAAKAEAADTAVVLLGHSMGARVAVHVADDPSVVGVVGLAPWWSSDDPIDTLPGRALVAAHGRRDRITSFAETTRYVERAKGIATAVELVDMGPLGHYMLTNVDAWNTAASTSALQLLRLHQQAHDS